MKGLILKDFLNMKSYMKILGLMILVQFVIFIPQGDVSFISGFIILLCTMMVITTISYDDMAKWDRYALTMPITRKEMVLSKYVIMLIFSISGAILNSILTIIAGYFMKNVNIGETLISSGAVLSAALLFGSVILPLLYKFGPEKARLLIILCALVPTAIVILGSQVVKKSGIPMPNFLKDLNTATPNTGILISLTFIIPAIAVVVVVISYLISLKIYNKKEF
ncbi:MAG: ABC-2 transporter permease [Oscillospiraceae bacterium]